MKKRVRNASTADNGAGPRLFEIVIADTGIGISRENVGRLFNPFEQLDSAPGRAKEGTGLGLSLTKKLVELHGGEIRAESPGLGKGSTFRVSLPAGTPREKPRG